MQPCPWGPGFCISCCCPPASWGGPDTQLELALLKQGDGSMRAQAATGQAEAGSFLHRVASHLPEEGRSGAV